MEGVDMLAMASSKTYIRLSKGLKFWCKNEGFDVLLNIDYKHFEKIENDCSHEELKQLKDTYNICEGNFDTDENGKIHNVKCMCGKNHILNLNIFFYDNPSLPFDHLILGSSCIEHLSMYDYIRDSYPLLWEKLKMWIEVIKEETRKIEYQPCVCCKKHKVKRGYKYKKESRLYWCVDCISNNYVKCIKCKAFRKYGFSTYHNKPMLQCHKCYFNSS